MSHSKTYCERQLLKFGISEIPRNNKFKSKNYHPSHTNRSISSNWSHTHSQKIFKEESDQETREMESNHMQNPIYTETSSTNVRRLRAQLHAQTNIDHRHVELRCSSTIGSLLARDWQTEWWGRESSTRETPFLFFFFRFNKVHKMTDLSLVIS